MKDLYIHHEELRSNKINFSSSSEKMCTHGNLYSNSNNLTRPIGKIFVEYVNINSNDITSERFGKATFVIYREKPEEDIIFDAVIVAKYNTNNSFETTLSNNKQTVFTLKNAYKFTLTFVEKDEKGFLLRLTE